MKPQTFNPLTLYLGALPAFHLVKSTDLVKVTGVP